MGAAIVLEPICQIFAKKHTAQLRFNSRALLDEGPILFHEPQCSDRRLKQLLGTWSPSERGREHQNNKDLGFWTRLQTFQKIAFQVVIVFPKEVNDLPPRATQTRSSLGDPDGSVLHLVIRRHRCPVSTSLSSLCASWVCAT